MKKILIVTILLIFTLGCAQDVKDDETPTVNSKDIQCKVEITKPSSWAIKIECINVAEVGADPDITPSIIKVNGTQTSMTKGDTTSILLSDDRHLSLQAGDTISMSYGGNEAFSIAIAIPMNRTFLDGSAFHSSSYIEVTQ